MNTATLLVFLWSIPIVSSIPYEIAVYTGNVFGAGTDAKVFITLYGEKGISPEKELDTKNSNDFERDHTDIYLLDFPFEGTLKKIKIRHDNSWFGSGWFLEKVVIKDPRGCMYTFPCHKWLAANYGDKKVARFIETRSVCEQDIKKKTKVCRKGHQLGISNGLIKNSQITASSSYDDSHMPFHARLNNIVSGSKGAWCSAFADDTEYLQINFNDVTSIVGIATQGQAMFDNWVTKYSLSYTTTGANWQDFMDKGKVKIFVGNKDRQSVVRHSFNEIEAKSVRIRPLAWDGLTNCMRLELYTCDKANTSTAAKKTLDSEEMKPIKQTKITTIDGTVLNKAVVYLKFETINGLDTIADQTDLHNDARIVNFARLSRFSERCGRGVDLNGGDVLLNGEHFINKPRKAVTIATWIKLYHTDGYNSIFDTIGGSNSTHTMGQYHLEVNNGSVRWFHRNEKGIVIFNVLTQVIVPPNIWTHVTSTYDETSGYAQVFVNAKFVTKREGVGVLSQDWEGRAGIGEHKGDRLLSGAVDEFFISDKALSLHDIKKLMKRCEFEKECFSPIGMESLKINDDQITASSVLQPHKPYYGRLNLISFYDDIKKSAWCSDDDDKEPYLTIDLKSEKTISGVAVQGASVYDSYVTSYKLCYSDNGRKYDCVKHNGTTEALMGSDDKDNIKIHWLNKFFDGRFVRFYPLSWYGENICMRVELYGCITGLLSDKVHEQHGKETNPTQTNASNCSVTCGKGSFKQIKHCNEANTIHKCSAGQKTYEDRTECIQPSCPECFTPMRMSNQTDQRFYEAMYRPHSSQSFANGMDGNVILMTDVWCADGTDKKQSFQEIDLGKPIKVTGIGIQGDITADRWVSSYRVSYSIKGNVWNNYTESYRLKKFRGNDDKKTISIRHLKHPITARYVRIIPLTWHGGTICMRTEIFGCDRSGSAVHKKSKPKKDAMQHNHESKPSKTNHNAITKSAPKKTIKLSPQKQAVTKIAAKHSYVGKPKTLNALALPQAIIVPITKTRESEFQVTLNPKKTHHVKLIPIAHVQKPGSAIPYKTQSIPHGLATHLFKDHLAPVTTYPHKTGYYAVNPVYSPPNGMANMLTNQRTSSGRLSNFKPRVQQSFNNFASVSRVRPGLYGVDNLGRTPGTLLEADTRKYSPQAPSLPGNLRHAIQPQTRVTQYLSPAQLQRPGYSKSGYKAAVPMQREVIHPPVVNGKNAKVTAQFVPRNPSLTSPSLQQKHVTTFIASTLKNKYKDSKAHHFLDERLLPKGKLKQQSAAKMDSVNPVVNDYNWSSFTPCTVTCGSGVRERYRKCNAMECLAEGTEIQVLPCYNVPCKATTEWTAYTSCSVSCGSGIRTRTRTCDGNDCPIPGKEISTIPCKKPDCPVLNLDFETIDGEVVVDKSGKGNNAFMREETRILPYKGICGHHVDLGYHGNLILQEETFRQKPKYGISIACWVNLQGSSRGSHSLFSTSKVVSESQVLGGYHFEVDDGRVRWFHRGRLEQPVFSVITSDVIRPNTWYHVVGTYSSDTSNAKVYVDGKLQAFSKGTGDVLDDDWGYKAAVGSFDFDGRYMRGKMDDFYMYDYEISPEQIKKLLSIKCPQPKKKEDHHFQFWR